MRALALRLACGLALPTLAHAAGAPAWDGIGGTAQHTAMSATAPQGLARIHWTTPVDDAPQAIGGELLIHYASPMITAGNTVLVPVKVHATATFRIEAHAAASGALLWTLPTNYRLPSHDWTPPLPAVLTPQNVLAVALAGGVVIEHARPDAPHGSNSRLAFYGLAQHDAAQARYDAAIQITTPLTAGPDGTLYFGFIVGGPTQVKDAAGHLLVNGFARLTAGGQGSWVGASAATGTDVGLSPALNAAPALSPDGKTLYVVTTDGSAGTLLALDAATLATKAKVQLADPASGWDAWVHPDSSASPMVGPDGDVYFGVLEQPFPNHNDRGWLLHFDATLATRKTPGSFGWDNTTSVVPAAAVPSYTGTSAYLLVSKDNNYLGIGSGDGLNRVALLDPNAPAADPVLPSVNTMAVVASVLGPSNMPGTSMVAGTALYPRYEWCINSAAVDVTGGTVIANSEDGHAYRWNLRSNTITDAILLNAPRPEAYTMTVIGPDGTAYAINNGTLYAIGK